MVEFEKAWKQITPERSEELATLWLEDGMLPDPEAAKKRAKEAVWIIRDEKRKPVGVSTAARYRLKLLNNNYLYEFRCFIAGSHRIAGLDVKLSKLTFDLLEEESKHDPEKPIGIFSVLENEILKKEPLWQRAVWPEIDMHFIGFTKEGHPVRVHYFKGAAI
jgi:hypothetical protein